MKKQKKIVHGETDWQRIEAMMEKEIAAAAKSDPDAQPLKKSELKKL